MSETTLQKLGSEVPNTEHFTDSQEKTQDFKHVAKAWTDQCISIDEGMEVMTSQQNQIEDIRGPLSDWDVVIGDNDQIRFEYKVNGKQYEPTEKAILDTAIIGGVSQYHLTDLMKDKTKKNPKGDEKLLFTRDKSDAELLQRTIRHTLFHADRVDQKKERLFRTWRDDCSLRALLSSRYAIVNNLWFLEILKELIPGGLLSHWRGDADTIFGNVLIPDTIRVESDSHYGGMLSVGNSEIGLRRILSKPSVFRAICMNGCIWEQQKGQSIKQVHKGDIDLAQLKLKIAENVNAQIPLLSDGITKLLDTKAMWFKDITLAQAYAETFVSYKIPKTLAPAFVKAHHIEAGILGSEANTAFGLQAAITRMGQDLDNESWFKYDELGGEIMSMSVNQWEGFVARAKNRDEKQVQAILGDISHLL